MTTSANPALGQTRTCAHCKSTILKSAAVCPACHHFLRFEAVKKGHEPLPAFQALRIEASVRQPVPGRACEYSVLVAVRNDRGEEITRRVAAVGALSPSEVQTFEVWVEVYMPEEARSERPIAHHS